MEGAIQNTNDALDEGTESFFITRDPATNTVRFYEASNVSKLRVDME